MMKKHYTKICPKCKSPDVNIEKTNPLQPAAGLPARYACNKCGFAGRNFPEADIAKLKKIRKAAKEKPAKAGKPELADTAYGHLMVGKVWKLYGIIALILGLILLSVNKALGAVIIIVGLFLIFFNPKHKK